MCHQLLVIPNVQKEARWFKGKPFGTVRAKFKGNLMARSRASHRDCVTNASVDSPVHVTANDALHVGVTDDKLSEIGRAFLQPNGVHEVDASQKGRMMHH